MATVYTGEYYTLLVEDVIDSVAYGLCVATIVNVARTIVFPSPNFKPETIPSKKNRIFLFAYAFILVALASFFYLPFIISRASAAGSYVALSLNGTPEEIREAIRRLKGYRLYDHTRSFWARNAVIPFYINDALAAILMEYIVYQTWGENKYVIGSTVILLLIHLAGSPLIFETVLLALALIYVVCIKTGWTLPYGPEKFGAGEGDSESKKATPATLVLLTSAIFAFTSYIDAILHLSGVVERTEVKFIKTVLFFGAFIIQVIVITYWAEGGHMCGEKKEGAIMLPEESLPILRSEQSAAVVGSASRTPNNGENWENVDRS